MARVAAGLRGEEETRQEQAAAAWRVLIARDIDRVRGLVAAFRFPGHEQVWIAEQDRPDAVQYAHERLLRMLPSFRGQTEGEYTGALVRCVRFACMDVCRRQMKHEMGIEGSLDETLAGADDEAPGRFDPLLARVGARRQEDEAHGRAELDAVATALAALANENMRRVISLTAQGHASSEIAERLELSVANIDQLRSRGLRQIRRHLESDD